MGCKPIGSAFPGSNPGPATRPEPCRILVPHLPGTAEAPAVVNATVYPRAAMDNGDSAVHEEAIDEAARDTAERVSRLRKAAKRVDRSPALLQAARRVRRQIPGDDRFGDPLSTAGTAPVQLVARGVSALSPDHDSVVQE